jgi:hypothetical protein
MKIRLQAFSFRFAEHLDIEPRLNRIRGCEYLPELQRAIQMELAVEAKQAVAA